MRELEVMLTNAGLAFCAARRFDPAGHRPDEPAFCVFDLDTGFIGELLEQFAQLHALHLDRSGSSYLWHPLARFVVDASSDCSPAAARGMTHGAI
jgi:hypothetical protein